MPESRHRHLAAPAIVLTLLALAGATTGCGGSGGRPDPGSTTVAAAPPVVATTAPPALAPPPASAPDPARALTVSQLVGQRILTGYDGPRPTRGVLRAVRRGTVGGVILFADNVPTAREARRATTALRRAAREGRQPPPLILIDQEGGEVRRLAAAPPTASPAQMRTAADARRQGEAAGRALRRVGIDVDLAPVADVPRPRSGGGAFLGSRAFGTTPAGVARASCGFARGLAQAGVAATLKHFPGLGRATASTDEEPVTVHATRAALWADAAAYRRCGDEVALTMIASAVYPALDRHAPAVLSPATYALLADTGFRGLTISDAFDTPSIVVHERAARRALGAGLDLLLFGQDEAGARRTHRRLVADTRAGRIRRASLRATAGEILAFKARLRRGQAGSPGAP